MAAFENNTLVRDPATGRGRVLLAGSDIPDWYDAEAPFSTPAPVVEEKGADAPEDTAGEFDPGAHTVEEVRAYLDTASADEVDRVQIAEHDGQGRKGIVEYVPKEA